MTNLILLGFLGFNVGDCIYWKDMEPEMSSVKRITQIKDDKFFYCFMPDCDDENWALLTHLEMYKKVSCK